MPSIGLGTGGLDPDHSYETISTAIALGYRLFDSAREYHNEFIFRDFLAETARDESAAKRRDLFLETKVWPTELGFIPTSQAVEYSWLEMETSYIDLYLLHWPRCTMHYLSHYRHWITICVAATFPLTGCTVRTLWIPPPPGGSLGELSRKVLT